MRPTRLFIADAAFEAVLAAVLLTGVAGSWLDATDYPRPITDTWLVGFAVALGAFALVLALAARRPSNTALTALASVNAVTALAGLTWLALARGFSPGGTAVLSVTVVVLAVLAALQAHTAHAARTAAAGQHWQVTN